MVTIFGPMVGVIGVALGLVAWRHFARQRAFVQNSGVTAGVVVGLREERDGLETRRFRYPKVQFRTGSGREVIFESSMAHSGDAWRIGDVVSVRYRHDQPESAEIASFAALWGSSLLFGFLAVVFLVLGTVLWLGLIPV